MKISVQKSAIALIAVFAILKSINCRYLPTRSQGNDLNKLRELMIDILDSSNEAQQLSQNQYSSLNNIENPSSKLRDDQRISLARNIFGSNMSSKDDSELLAAYFNQYSSTGATGQHNMKDSLNKIYGRIHY